MGSKPKDKKQTGRVRLEGGRASVNLNKSGTVRGSAGLGGQPKTRFNPKGETHGDVRLEFRFGGGKKGKKGK